MGVDEELKRKECEGILGIQNSETKNEKGKEQRKRVWIVTCWWSTMKNRYFCCLQFQASMSSYIADVHNFFSFYEEVTNVY